MTSSFRQGWLQPPDAKNPFKPHTQAFELFELGRYYRTHVPTKPFEGLHIEGNVYRGTRSGEAFRYDYSTQSIEPVQDVRLERSGRGR